MKYTVTSSKKVCGKLNGEELTESDILRSGGNVKHLLASGHIKETKIEKVTQPPKEIKEEPQVQKEEPDAFVFNNKYNEGDK